MKKILPIILASFFIAAIAFFVKVNAQIATRVITITPPGKELSLSPGERTEGVLRVTNDSDEVLTFELMVRDYIVDDNKGTPKVLAPNTLSNKYSAANWIAVYPSSFTIAPHQRQELNYYVQVPADATPGGHYAATMYQPYEVIGVQGTGTGVSTHLGTLFYINVKGDIKENAHVAQFKGEGFSENGPVAITTEIQNNGDLHIKPRGTITVKNMIGQVVATKPLGEHNIFPEKSYLQTDEFGKKWMIGRYTAQLAATYGQNSNLPLVATTSFIVFPWKVSVVVILVVVIIILGVIAYRRRNKKGSVTESAEQTSSENHPTL